MPHHLSNLYNNFAGRSGDLLDQATTTRHFRNSGAEANEALKRPFDQTRQRNLGIEDGFHGRTFGAMSATMQDKIQNGFAHGIRLFKAIYNDVDSLKASVTLIQVPILKSFTGEGGGCPSQQNLRQHSKAVKNREFCSS